MHIPDNYLSPSTCGAFFLIMIPIWKKASKKIKNEISNKQMPLLGVCGAFSFLIMMFNVPLPGGTSGHAIGGALSAILLGPEAAMISITIALFIQALFFGDGGILSLGVNCFNMAFIMPFSAYYIYNFFIKNYKFKNQQFISTFFSGYLSIIITALFVAFELGVQPYLFKDSLGVPLYNPYSLRTTLPAIVIPHIIVIGLIEGFVTSSILKYIKKVSPEVIYVNSKKKNTFFSNPLRIILSIMIIFLPIGLLTKTSAWGEWDNNTIKSLVGFIPKGMKNGISYKAFFSDYSLTGLNNIYAYIISGILGIFTIYLISRLFQTKILKK